MMILLKTETPLMTVDEFYDFVNRPENQARSFELVRGEVIEVSRPTRLHGLICSNISRILGNYTVRKKKGYVVSNDTGVVLESDPDTVRGPDVAYFEDVDRFEDLPEKWGDTVPRMLVEVLSPNDTAQYIIDKINDYLNNGVEVAWIVDPDARTVAVYSKTGVYSLGENDRITGGEVLPGFRCKVAEFFVLPGTKTKAKRKRR